MSELMTSRFSSASIVAVSNIDSVAAVGLAASSLLMYSRWVLPLAQVRPLMLPSRLGARKIRLSIARRFSCGVRS